MVPKNAKTKAATDRSSARAAARMLTVPHLLSRLQDTASTVHSKRLKRLIREIDQGPLDLDRIKSGLMAVFRDTHSLEIYTLLYELNARTFRSRIFNLLRRYGSRSDPNDVLQDVFLSIYRYPGSFREEKGCSFKNWSLSIIRNAAFKHLKRNTRHYSSLENDQELVDKKGRFSPLDGMVKRERMDEWRRLYGFSLSLYLHAYNTRLKPREKEALHKVEVENLSYKAAAHAMGLKPENFKMVVCRARKKIFNYYNNMGSVSPATAFKSTG